MLARARCPKSKNVGQGKAKEKLDLKPVISTAIVNGTAIGIYASAVKLC